jgi:hypothetical protein
MSTIELTNVQAIKQLTIKVPDDGGVVELRGNHGTGKSTAIEAIQTALRSDGKLELTDGAERGSVAVGGAKVTFTRGQTRHGGELLVEHIEGKFSLGTLIDPGIKDPDRADAKRIQTMLALANVKADASLFAELQPLVDVKGIKADDLVTLAAKAKASLELEARDREAAAAVALDKAKRESPPPDARLDGARDPQAVAAELEALVKEDATLTAQRAAYDAAMVRQEAARERLVGVGLAELEATATEASHYQTVAMENAKQKTLEANEIRARLKDAESRLANATSEAANAVKEAKAAATAVANAKSLEATLGETVPDEPDDLRHAMVRVSLAEARQEVDRQAVIRGHVNQAAKAAEHFAAHDGHQQRAKLLRDGAARIDGILSEAIGRLGSPLRVRSGRLVLDTHRGEELFGDLSHGERTLQSLDIGLGLVPEGGILTVDQEEYGGLHDLDRQDLNVKAKLKRVLVLAAVVTTDDQLTAEAI